MFIDSHTHLDDERFDSDRDLVIKNLKANEIDLVVNIGADIASSISTMNLAKTHENIYAAVGVHPHSVSELVGVGLDEIENLARQDKAVAIGEIGLDYYYENSPKNLQKEYFIEQIRLAKKLDLPIVIHSREAVKDTLDIIKSEKSSNLRGVMHCFSSSVEIAKEYIKLGFYIAIGGVVTFKNARVTKEVAQFIPLENLLIETDCPYLAPEPFRGKRNEPKYIKYTAEEIAKIKEIDLEEIAYSTSANAKKLFGIATGDAND
ncbi:TatD family deoxyribonuclease [Soehngenia saccharolytica]|jgi:TatD DNase family protein|nr:TatD family deoxyribonuclease [Soehngenia saccharolytica]